jgi:hypothetical protein
MRAGNAPKALDYFNQAIQSDSLYSDAWYYRSKMILRIGDVLVYMLWSEIRSLNPDGTRDSNKVPFFPRDTMVFKGVAYPHWPSTVIDTIKVTEKGYVDSTIYVTNADTLYNHYSRLYSPSMESYKCMKRIWDGFTPHGTIGSAVIRADYLFLSSLFTSFIICDVNLDYKLDTSYIDNKERQAYVTFAKSFTNIHDIHLNADDIYGIYTVADINKNIDSILNSSNITLNVLNSLDGEIQGSKYSDTTDKTMLSDPRKQLQDIVRQAGYYYHDDKKDNDFDWYDTDSNGVQNKMVWMDINNDKHITLDLNDSAGSMIVCDSAHFMADVQQSGLGYPRPPSPDPEQNNLPLMFLARNYGYRLVGTTKYYFYCGPHKGEFVAGDYGVDEEKLDDKNNDGDMNGSNGLKDEDTRISPDSLDNDGDYVEFSVNHPLPNPGTLAAQKVYTSYIVTWSHGYINRRAFFTPMQAQSLDTIIDDFGNQYRIFKFFDTTRVKAFMEKLGAVVGNQMTCMVGDTLVIRAEPVGHPIQDAIIWFDKDNDGLIDRTMNGTGSPAEPHFTNADTTYLKQTGYQGEFIAGDWGVDEEVYDGCDNDGDGKIDEDGDRKWFEAPPPNGVATQIYHRPCQ